MFVHKYVVNVEPESMEMGDGSDRLVHSCFFAPLIQTDMSYCPTPEPLFLTAKWYHCQPTSMTEAVVYV